MTRERGLAEELKKKHEHVRSAKMDPPGARPTISAALSVFYIYRDWSRSGIKPCNLKNQIWDNPGKKVVFIPTRLRNQIWDKYHHIDVLFWHATVA